MNRSLTVNHHPLTTSYQLPVTKSLLLITYCLLLLSRRLNKRDLVDLFQRGQSTLHSINCRLAKEMHSFVARRPPDFAAWPLGSALSSASKPPSADVLGLALTRGSDGADATSSRPLAADAPDSTNAANAPPAGSWWQRITSSMSSNASYAASSTAGRSPAWSRRACAAAILFMSVPSWSRRIRRGSQRAGHRSHGRRAPVDSPGRCPQAPVARHSWSCCASGEECLQVLAGDDAAAADLDVAEAPGAHLVVEQVAGQAGDLRDLVHGVGDPLGLPAAGEVGHQALPEPRSRAPRLRGGWSRRRADWWSVIWLSPGMSVESRVAVDPGAEPEAAGGRLSRGVLNPG